MPSFDRNALALLIELHDRNTLAMFLVERSNVPGPRANLSLAAAVADLLPAGGVDWAVETVVAWSGIGPELAGGNDPHIMLPFVAAQVAGQLWIPADASQRAALDDVLHRSANDPRWRVREGAAMAFQRIGVSDFQHLRSLFSHWTERPTLLEWRAVVAGLAEPALMRQPERAAFGLELAMQAFDALMEVTPTKRNDEDAQVLRKALGYAISVFLAADPAGFNQLETLARVQDKDAVWIVRENLKKARIAKNYPDACARVAALFPD